MTITAALPGTHVVSRTVVVPRPAADVFALLTDPAEHVRLDGTGSVRGVVEAPERLVLGSVFRMRMPGYTTTNTVTEYRPDRLIAWRHRGRHVWRWELVPVAGGTQVTESFDYSAKRALPVVRLLGLPGRAAGALDKTLAGLAARLA